MKDYVISWVWKIDGCPIVLFDFIPTLVMSILNMKYNITYKIEQVTIALVDFIHCKCNVDIPYEIQRCCLYFSKIDKSL